jgi:DNA ligase-1
MITKQQIFTPIESRNPVYLAGGEALFQEVIAEHHGTTRAEIKEDGYRMQIHKRGGEVRAFTRSMNNYLLDLFPELETTLKTLPDCIIDTELIGEGIGHSGFQAVKKRFRARISEKGKEEYLQSDLTASFPVALRVFDTLYWEGQSLLESTLEERRAVTENISGRKIQPSVSNLISDPEELKSWFERLVGENYEGLVCKDPSSLYSPGARNSEWIKLKRAENLDLVVLGVYLDQENQSQISQVLCGTYNPESKHYETLAKVNAKRERMDLSLAELLAGKYVSEVPKNITLNPVLEKDLAELGPDYWIKPQQSVVVEVAAMNIQRGKNWNSCGYDGKNAYSLRIGWLRDIRYDKNPKQASTTELVQQIYLAGKE